MRRSRQRTVLLALWLWAIGGAAHAAALTVDECVRLALAHSPAAQAAGFDVDAASALVRAALGAYVPRLAAHAEYGRSAGFDTAVTNGGSTAAVLTVETSLLDGGLRDAQLNAARAHLRSATARAQQRRADVAFAVRTTYFTALDAHVEALTQQDTQARLREYVVLLQRQESAGLVAHNDVLRARLAIETASAAERAASANADAALNELAVATGAAITPDTLAEPVVNRPATPAEWIDRSPVLIDAQAAVDAARRDVDAVRSEWRGHMDLTASGGALGVVPDTTFQDNRGGQFLLGFSVPLYDGGATTARVAAAMSTARSAEAALQESRRLLGTAMTRAILEATRAEADRVGWQRALPDAAEHFELMRARYFGGGNVRLLEVLDALTQYVDAQLAVQRATLAYRIAIATQQQLIGEVTP